MGSLIAGAIIIYSIVGLLISGIVCLKTGRLLRSVLPYYWEHLWWVFPLYDLYRSWKQGKQLRLSQANEVKVLQQMKTEYR
jgi:hypothetical protein